MYKECNCSLSSVQPAAPSPLLHSSMLTTHPLRAQLCPGLWGGSSEPDRQARLLEMNELDTHSSVDLDRMADRVSRTHP